MSEKLSFYNCEVKNCRNNSYNCKLYPFPTDKRSLTWVKFCQNADLEKYSNLSLKRYKRICIEHFENHNFFKVVGSFRNRLRPNAIPTLNGPEPTQEYLLLGNNGTKLYG